MPSGSMLSLDVEGASMNNTNNVNGHLHPIGALGRARCPRKYGLKRGGTKQAKRIRMAIGPIEEATKTMALAEIDGCESNCDDSDAKLSRGNNDNNFAEAPSDSAYCEGDE